MNPILAVKNPGALVSAKCVKNAANSTSPFHAYAACD
jgi:hypothetical protein